MRPNGMPATPGTLQIRCEHSCAYKMHVRYDLSKFLPGVGGVPDASLLRLGDPVLGLENCRFNVGAPISV